MGVLEVLPAQQGLAVLVARSQPGTAQHQVPALPPGAGMRDGHGAELWKSWPQGCAQGAARFGEGVGFGAVLNPTLFFHQLNTRTSASSILIRFHAVK